MVSLVRSREDEQQSQQSQQSQEEDGLLFSCRCESARSVAMLLSCLRRVVSKTTSTTSTTSTTTTSSKKNQPMMATVFVTSSALSFHVYGTGRQSQASVDMQSSMFSEYHVRQEKVSIVEEEEEGDKDKKKEEVVVGGEFSIQLSTVMECLQLLDMQHHPTKRQTLCMSYDLDSCIFQMEVLEEGSGGGSVFLTCAIPGMCVPDDEDDDRGGGLAVAFRSSPIVARCILESQFLQDAIHDLNDVPGAVLATLGLSSQGLEIISVGNDRECHIALPSPIFVSLDTTNTTTTNTTNTHSHNMITQTYPLNHLLTSMKGLEIATESCISINARGMMAIQHQVLDKLISTNGQPNYVDFIMTCLEQEQDQQQELTTMLVQNTHPPSPPTRLLQESTHTHSKTQQQQQQMDTYSLGDNNNSSSEEESEESPQLFFGQQLDTTTISSHRIKYSQKRQRRRRNNNNNNNNSQQSLSSSSQTTTHTKRQNNNNNKNNNHPTHTNNNNDNDDEEDFDITAKVRGSIRRKTPKPTHDEEDDDGIRYGSDDDEQSLGTESPNKLSFSPKKQKIKYTTKPPKHASSSDEEHEFHW